MSKNFRPNKNKRRHDSGNKPGSRDTNFLSLPPPSDTIVQELDDTFNRKYVYRIGSLGWRLPGSERMFHASADIWQDEELQAMKADLNGVKNHLSCIDIIQWQSHTQAMHAGGLISNYLRYNVGAELCTQAWCKFYAIVSSFPDITGHSTESALNSVHLCEAPGAFVASLNHFLHNYGRHAGWRWLATTLSPYYEGNSLQRMIDDDRFIRATRDCWCFGADNTGDIMNTDNIDDIISMCVARGMERIDLVTADGSIDCANDPGEQEARVSRLHYSELVAALHLLSPGGCLVLKMFTLFEHSSVCLMFLLSCLFSKVTVFKPVTSKPGNSEVYVVAEKYNSADPNLLAVLKSHVGDTDEVVPIFSKSDIPESFLAQHRECCCRFVHWQASTIEFNLRYFNKSMDRATKEHLNLLRNYHVKTYIEQFRLKPIGPSDRLVPITEQSRSPYLKPSPCPHMPAKRRYSGTLNERHTTMNLPWQLRLQKTTNFDGQLPNPISSIVGRELLTDGDIASWKVECGKPLVDICSTRFCDNSLLASFRDALEHSKVNGCVYPCGMLQQILHCVLTTAESSECQIRGVFCLYNDNSSPRLGSSDCEMNSGENTDETIQMLMDISDLSALPTATVLCGHLTLEAIHGALGADIDHALSVSPLSDMIDILKVITVGQHCLFVTGVLLTRRAVGILYVLYSCFTRVAVYKDGSMPQLYLIGLGFRGCCPYLITHLSTSQQQAATSGSSKHEFLSIVPMDCLYDLDFYAFVRSVNEEFIKLRINFLLQQHSQMMPGNFAAETPS